MNKELSVNVLGTNYTINKVYGKKAEETFDENSAGYCDPTTHEITVTDYTKEKVCKDTVTDTQWYLNKILRHEILHAFLFESGLAENSDWALNEEMVDWFALQFHKIAEEFKQLGV